MEECNEYRAALSRNFEPYSEGHRLMYDVPIAALKGQKVTVLDVGAGIGYGLDRMLDESVLMSYVGFEPCNESYQYLFQKHRKNDKVTLIEREFDGIPTGSFDYVFCIEVIEHVLPEKRQKMLVDLFDATGKALFLSTPDRERDSHGVYTADELKKALKNAGFSDVVVLREQWTDLYVCTR